MKKRTPLLALGLVVLGLISGLSLYGPAKEKDMEARATRLLAARRKQGDR